MQGNGEPNSSQHAVSESSSGLPVVKGTAISQSKLNRYSTDELYTSLLATNPALALWLRRRSVELSDDLSNRALDSRLALEALQLIEEQLSIKSLQKLFQ